MPEAPDNAAEQAPEGAAAGEWSSLGEAHEHALVPLAMGVECWVAAEGDRFTLRVDAARAAAVGAELSLYAAEQAARPREAAAPTPLARSGGAGLALAWAASLMAAFWRQGTDPAFTARFSNWNEAVLERGEWWRPFTALFLHADAGHLLGNLGMGGLFCFLAAQSLGPWRGWLLILAAGTAGNALTGWLHYPEPHRAIGASTATFGALGILVGAGTRAAWHSRSFRGLRGVFVPLVAGLVALGWWGGGGVNTDVTAHLAGWACGVALGWAAAGKRAG